MTKTPLMDIVNAAAARFDQEPVYLASIEARAELAAFEAAAQRAQPEVLDTVAPATNPKEV